MSLIEDSPPDSTALNVTPRVWSNDGALPVDSNGSYFTFLFVPVAGWLGKPPKNPLQSADFAPSGSQLLRVAPKDA